jgi:putative spermidine/putrescine transport system substrate-binding protein
MPVEDFQEQEYEFLRRLEEERIGRRKLLKRGLATAAGLTVIALPEAALAARQKALANPPIRGTKKNLAEIVAAAKKEGHLNVIALPPDWANYGEIISTFTKKYGIGITSDNPNGSSSDENQAIVSLKGDPRAPDVVDVNPTFAVAGTVSGLYTRYYVMNYATVPRSMKDTRGLWTGDYYGSITIGYNANVVKTAPKSFADLLKSTYKNQVALNGSPLKSGSAIAGVFAAALANGGSLSNVGPGVDWFAKARSVGNYIPVETTPQTVASGQTPISIDWDYNNFAYVKEFPSANWKVVIPSDGQYGGYYCQAVSATAPHPWAARLWQEFLFSDQGQILYLKGYAHPARFADLVARKAIPKSVTGALPASWLNSKGAKFASLGQQAKAKVVINTEWPAKLGSS